MNEVRGEFIKETARELAFRSQLKALAKQRERRNRPGKRKEACTAATVQTSKSKKPLLNYIAKEELCQAGASKNNPVNCF